MNLNSDSFGPIRRLFAVGGVAVAGAIALTGCGFIDGSTTDSTGEDEVSNAQLDAAGDAAAGDCLPEPPVGGPTDAFAVECSDPSAFWTLTAIEADPDVAATADQSIADPAAVYELCGEEVGANVPGQAWTDWNMIFNPDTLEVDYLFCLEAIGNPTVDGATPTFPSAEGECFSSSDFLFGTYPCDSASIDSTIVSVATVDPADWATAEAEAEAIATSECTGDWTYYLPAVDQFGRTTTVYCVN